MVLLFLFLGRGVRVVSSGVKLGQGLKLKSTPNHLLHWMPSMARYLFLWFYLASDMVVLASRGISWTNGILFIKQ